MGTVEFSLQEHYNPLGPSVEYTQHLTKILIFKYLRREHKKFPMSAAPMSR